MNALQPLPALRDRLPVTALDRAFADFLMTWRPSPQPAHWVLATLASHQLGRGHACLDLAALLADPAGTLGWEAAAIAALPLPGVDQARDLPWAQAPDAPEDGTRPMVFVDGPRPLLYLRRAWKAEQQILASLAERLALPDTPMPANRVASLDALFGPADPRHDAQRRACEVAATGRFTIITGGPGTGKTTTVARLLYLLAQDAQSRGSPLSVQLAAPTGKAASRLSQSLGAQIAQLPGGAALGLPTTAVTLHRLLGWRGDSPAAAPKAVEADVVVVDEASMIDLEMMARLLQSVPASARLILLGDKDQLASVEAGAVLAQLCARTDLAPRVVTLTYSHRFGADSGIGRWAALVNAGDDAGIAEAWAALRDAGETAAPVSRMRGARLPSPQFEAVLRAGWADWLAQLAVLRAGTMDCSDAEAGQLLDAFAAFQVLTALREGPWGAGPLNEVIARSLGFPRLPWYAGRPVLVTQNDYGLRLMNGDVGLCLPRDGGLRVAFRESEGSLRWVPPSRLEAVDTVFAMTVHKSQGSEFGTVLLVLPDEPGPLLTRELLYTGITRARSRVILQAARPAVLGQAVRRRVSRSGGLAG